MEAEVRGSACDADNEKEDKEKALSRQEQTTGKGFRY